MVTVNFLFLCLLEWWFPAADIDQCPEFDRELYAEIVGGRGGSGAKNGQREGARRERYDHEPEPGERGDIEQTSAAETVLTDGVRNGLSTP